MSLTLTADGVAITLAEGEPARRCGGCTLCCKLLPVRELAKPAGKRCVHQRAGKGCAVYRKAGFPASCRWWNCRWLADDDTGDLSRPDRSRYVIDIAPDFITITDLDGEARHVEVVQIWVDPGYPDAHRDPKLRAYLERRAAEGKAALLRWDNERAVVLFAPALSSDRQWNDVETNFHTREHSLGEIVAALA